MCGIADMSRNLAIDGGHELCAEMFNKGIMSHITTLTGKVSSRFFDDPRHQADSLDLFYYRYNSFLRPFHTTRTDRHRATIKETPVSTGGERYITHMVHGGSEP